MHISITSVEEAAMNRTNVLRMALSGLLLSGSLPALAGTISGTVTAGEKPVAGALVTLWNDAKNRKETVYTDDQGRYTLHTGFTGKLVLRARTPYFKDVNKNIELAADTTASVDFAVEKIASLEELSASLPASAHAAALMKFPDEQTKAAFINQCNYCHQQGNATTRRPRSAEEWSSAIWRMEGYGAYITHGEHKRIARMLTESFDGKPINAIQTQDYSPELAKARIEEWHAAGPMSFLHDTIVGSDEKLYGIDEAQDIMYILDRQTGKIEQSQMPSNGHPIGGDFAGLQLPLGIFTGNHGPHSAVETADGRMFITGALSSSLIMFRPATKEWKTYEVPRGFLWRKGLYPHTIRADHEGNMWFTAMSSNRIVKFDIKTEQFTDIAAAQQRCAALAERRVHGRGAEDCRLVPTGECASVPVAPQVAQRRYRYLQLALRY
jgi:virginiamycin B lyase